MFSVLLHLSLAERSTTMNRTLKLSLKLAAIAAVLSLVPVGLGPAQSLAPAEACGSEGNCVRSAGSTCYIEGKVIWDFRTKNQQGGD